MSAGVSRQGGPGIGGGMTAGRHRAYTLGRTSASRAVLECISCRKPVTATLVVQLGRVYCSWDCASSLEPVIPGQYLG
jgi:hypothetical protein